MPSSFSQRVLSIDASATVAAFARAGEFKRQGIDLISLVAGEPDFDTPQNVKDAAIRAIREGHTKYTNPASGLPELKQAICGKLWRDNGLSYAPSQIMVTCGAKQTIFDAIVALVEDGDEAIIPAPYWTSYADQVRLLGGKPVIVPTGEQTGFCMTPERLREAISPRTKIVLLNSPCNPTGAVYGRKTLQTLADIMADAGIWVISDEIYEKILYDDAEHVSIAALNPDLRALTVNGLSKAYAMTGWRVGYGAGPQDLIDLMVKVQSQETTNTCTISQYAAVEALTGPQESVETFRRLFQHRRDFIVRQLNAIPGFRCNRPGGAFYAFPDVRALFGRRFGCCTLLSDIDICNFLLEKAGVAGVPGSGFGAPGFLRFTYAASIEHIEQAMHRIKTAVASLT